MPSEHSDVQSTFTSSGKVQFEITVRHPELNRYQVIRATSRHEIVEKANAKMAQWDDMWRRRQATERKRQERAQRAQAIEDKKTLAEERTLEAQQAQALLETILADGLKVSLVLNWEKFKGELTTLFPKPRKPVMSIYQAALLGYKNVDELRASYYQSLAEWRKKQDLYLQERATQNRKIDKKHEKYSACDPEMIIEYCEMVLSNSQYPDYFPQSYDLDYNAESRTLVVDYQLPPLMSIPTLKEVRYIQSRDEFTEKEISQAQLNRTYDSLLYQIALRTVYELFESDVANALSIVAFNGYVRSIDAATGQEVNACVLSLMVSKEEFEKLNLQSVDPKACFKALKGVGSSKLHSLAPVAPILKIDRDDARFVDAYAVVDGIQEGDNLAAMDWEDFEHLIRELFEKEFSGPGSEVKVTRASRDGGIDAVAFDPDPLRGGKIVIQAKRYTNTVGVSAVRDLYGTVLNEGAIKGILVTTADYGPDAYSFAKNKPLTLLNGGNLLHLLEKHGHKAWIDLKEAKKTLNEQKKG